MEFGDSPGEAAFRAEARAWLEQHAVKKGSPDDFSSGFFNLDGVPPSERPAAAALHAARCRAWQATLAAGGWAGITWPREAGGRGGSPVEAMIFAEEQARFGVSADVLAIGITMAGPTIIAHGSAQQQERFLLPLLRGEHLWCQLFSEPGAGSDLAALATRAVVDGDELVINGQKVWTSSADQADWGMLLVRTDPDAPKHRGITYVLLDMRTPGIEVRPLRQMNGGSHFAEVFFTDVRVPCSDVLGPLHGGWGVAMTTLANERMMIGDNPMLRSDALMRLARRYRRADDPVVRAGIAAAFTREQILRYFGFRVRTALGRGEMPGPEASCMKLAVAQHLARTASLALAIEGADGLLAHATASAGEPRWHWQFLQAPAIRIAGGSDEVQRNIMGERVLGLPPEVRVDKQVPFRTLATASAAGRVRPSAPLTSSQGGATP